MKGKYMVLILINVVPKNKITIHTERERERERERESSIKYPSLLWCKNDVNGNVNGFHNTTDCVCSNKKDFIRFK